jgi:hypothetical protein
MANPRSLDEALRSHLPGGSRMRPTVNPDGLIGLNTWARIAGTDRGVSFHLGLEASLLGPSPKRPPDYLFIETTKPELDGLPPAEWARSMFMALCMELQPSLATASSMGERGAIGRRYGWAREHLSWLTFLGADEIRGLDRAALERTPGVEVTQAGEGLIIQLGQAPAARTYAKFLRIVDAAESVVGLQRIAALKERRSSVHVGYPAPPAPERAPTPIRTRIVKPAAAIDDAGAQHVLGHRYEGVRVANLEYRTPGGVLEGFEAVKCDFDNVGIGTTDSRLAPVVVRNCRLVRCRAQQPSLWYATFEDCVIDGLRGAMSYYTSGPLLKHVVVRGNVDTFFIRPPGQIKPDPVASTRHMDYYADVDWALDISEARFRRCDIDGVPGRLVRRDPATQVLITRDRVLTTPWEEVMAGTVEFFSVQGFVRSGAESEVVVACPRDDRFEAALASLALMREAGIAEPD